MCRIVAAVILATLLGLGSPPGLAQVTTGTQAESANESAAEACDSDPACRRRAAQALAQRETRHPLTNWLGIIGAVGLLAWLFRGKK